ncbi:hypothetical protein LIA77_08417 [Sarocladium implicatum]|nr:hypothetical protein LIA77_08417 [Sarocladium implicatum]
MLADCHRLRCRIQMCCPGVQIWQTRGCCRDQEQGGPSVGRPPSSQPDIHDASYLNQGTDVFFSTLFWCRSLMTANSFSGLSIIIVRPQCRPDPQTPALFWISNTTNHLSC